MPNGEIFKKNLHLLRKKFPNLADKTAAATRHPNMKILTSRSGRPVPSLIRNGRPFPMHSRFNPDAEGKKIADTRQGEFIVVFGLGGGYHVTQLLKQNDVSGLVLIEKDISVFRSILEHIPYTEILTDPRTILLVDPSPEQLQSVFLSSYLPILHGTIGSITLRPRWDSNPEWFSSMANVVRETPELLGRDYTTQMRFGQRWFNNIIINMAQKNELSESLPQNKHWIVAAAGPSLADQFPEIRRHHQNGGAILSTDTSLPFFSSMGLAPNIVLSIDCQAASYHHFFKGLPRETTLVMDISSPPMLTRQTNRIFFVSGGHPFSNYLNSHYRSLPSLDTQGGNVTHTAISLALLLGAKEIRLLGADFSYPSSIPYVPGTYIHNDFNSRCGRIHSAENRFWHFVNSATPRREICGDTFRLRTKSMDFYRESLERMSLPKGIRLIPERGRGVPININSSVSKAFSSSLSFPVEQERVPWTDCLREYRCLLTELPPFEGVPQIYMDKLNDKNLQIFTSILPAAATFRSQSSHGAEAVNKARTWMVDRITQVLANTLSVFK